MDEFRTMSNIGSVQPSVSSCSVPSIGTYIIWRFRCSRGKIIVPDFDWSGKYCTRTGKHIAGTRRLTAECVGPCLYAQRRTKNNNSSDCVCCADAAEHSWGSRQPQQQRPSIKLGGGGPTEWFNSLALHSIRMCIAPVVLYNISFL